MKKIQYTRNIGKKFNEDGSAKEFPGNTVICHVPKDSDTYQFLLKFRNKLMKQSWANKFSFLPPSSYHMTVFEGVCDQVRKSSHWTSKLPLDIPLEQVDDFLISEWKKIDKPESFSLMARLLSVGGAMVIRLKPISNKENKNLRDFRDLLSKSFGIKQPNHNLYGFHVSFGYTIIKLTFIEKIKLIKFIKQTQKEIQNGFGIMKTNEPELTFFADMTNFAPTRQQAIRNCKN